MVSNLQSHKRIRQFESALNQNRICMSVGWRVWVGRGRDRCVEIIEKWREIGAEVIHVRHSSTNPKSKLHKRYKGFNFNPLCSPKEGEIVLTKSVNSCFVGTNLKQILDDKKCETVVIIGLTTDHCVSTTTRMAGNYGFNTFLISDATATFDKIGINGEKYNSELMHFSALASLKDEFANVISSNELFKLL